MNAITFIKQHGVDRAREVVEGAPETATHFTEALGGHYAKEGVLKMKPQWLWFNTIDKQWYWDFSAKDHIHLPDLKRLVESVDLVNSYGGVQESEWEISSQDDLPEYCYRLRQAIDDYESIYGGEHV